LDNDKIQKHMFKLADMDKVLKKQMRSLTKSCLPSPASAMVVTPKYPDGVELEPRSAKSWKMHAVLGKPRGRGNTVQKHTTEVKKWHLAEQPTSAMVNTEVPMAVQHTDGNIGV
jgi:hypothetical protein